MTDVSTKKNRPHRMRRWVYAPLVAAVTAGAICTGAGIGSAGTGAAPDAVTASTSTADTAPGPAGDKNWWSLYNFTSKPIYGEWSVQTGKNVSEVKIAKDRQLQTSNRESRPRNDSVWWKSYWMGHICYNNAWWNFPRTAIDVDQDFTFTLDVWPGDRLHATWNPRVPGSPFDAFLIRNPYEAPC
ncbi:hypothetical protein [Rhodococcus jostii]|uniref:hypothetical protein n=1 Tax=Rhodococcus jostii TaxID=132919 RepID=UPI0036333BD7